MKSSTVHLSGLILLMMLLVLAVSSHAALVNNGNGTITDTDMNLMWMQDANYAYTSGYDADGLMNWNDAMTWANGLVYAGYDDWRLPSALNSDGSGPCSQWDCTDSEIGHIWFIELSNPSQHSTYYPGPFNNLNGEAFYWTKTEYSTVHAWYFNTLNDYQYYGVKSTTGSPTLPWGAWAVRDLTVVPEPVSSSLFIVGGATLGFRCFRKKLIM